jgi:hypothetical protein
MLLRKLGRPCIISRLLKERRGGLVYTLDIKPDVTDFAVFLGSVGATSVVTSTASITLAATRVSCPGMEYMAQTQFSVGNYNTCSCSADHTAQAVAPSSK